MPKKSKKGGGGKGGGKTEEERLLYQQQRAQAEEEMAKKKEEILTLFLKDKLQKEERNTAVNLLKLNDGWRSILRQTRAAELRQDLTVLSQTFERRLDGLDSVTKNLLRDLQEAERQSAQVRRRHLQHVERLRAQQDRRLALVQQRWDDGLQQLSSGFGSERKQMLTNAGRRRSELEDAAFVMEQKHKEVMGGIHTMYDESMASIESALQERKAELLMKHKEALHPKMMQIRETKQLCSLNTREYKHILVHNQQLIEKFNGEVKRMRKLQEKVVKLRAKLSCSNTDNQSLEREQTAATDHVKQKTLRLREQLTHTQAAARKQLADLTVQGAAAKKKLVSVIAKGETVLRAGELCLKLENEQREELRAERTGPETEEPEKEASVSPELRQVTRRLNAAVLRREALRTHRDDLRRENQQLRLLVRQHLDGMTVSGDALDGRHALLAVHQAPVASAPTNTGRRQNVIEAAHAAKHSL